MSHHKHLKDVTAPLQINHNAAMAFIFAGGSIKNNAYF